MTSVALRLLRFQETIAVIAVLALLLLIAGLRLPGASAALRSTAASTPDTQHVVHSINIGEYGCGDPFNSDATLQDIVRTHGIPYIRAPFRDGCTDKNYLDMLGAIVGVGATPQVTIHGNCLNNSSQLATNDHWLSLVDQATSGTYWVEYGNEEDIGCGTGGISAQQYVNGWNRDVPTLHANHPRAKFIGPVTAGHNTGWINLLLSSGSPHPDAISWHWYPCGLATSETQCLTNTSHIDNDIAQTDAYETQVGVSAPIWITEWDMGFNQDQTTWLNSCFTTPACVQNWLSVAITHLAGLHDTSNLAAAEFYVLTNGNPNSETDLVFPPPSDAFTYVGAAFFGGIPVLPATPTGVIATAGDGSVALTWTAPVANGSPAVTQYVITASDGCAIQGSMTVSGSPPATTATFTGLTNGTAYSFTVAAINSNGTGAPSAASNVVTPSGAAPSWLTACSSHQYSLSKSDGSTWQDLDPTRLSLTFTPAADSYAVISGNTDLFTSASGYAQDIGVSVNGTLNAWKESGGRAGTFSPNAAALQTVVQVTHGVGYTVRLQWKANVPDPYTIFAGAGPIIGAYSPTRLTVQLIPSASGTVWSSAITSQPSLTGSDGTTWVDMDPGLSVPFVVPSGTWDAMITVNADLWTSTAGYNQDLAINLNGSVAAWKESGGKVATFSPNAAFVQSVVPVTSGSSYTAKVQWKTNHGSSGSIHAGAGSGSFSPTRITVVLIPPASAGAAISNLQYSLTNSDGATWHAIDLTHLLLTLSPSAATSYAIGAGADLFTAASGYNQDLGVMVSGGAYGSGTLVAWKESGGSGGTYSPNAAYVTTDLHLQAGVSYTVWLVWKANRPAGGGTIYAAAGPLAGSFSPTSLVAVALSQP
jgi:hypothetical protein